VQKRLLSEWIAIAGLSGDARQTAAGATDARSLAEKLSRAHPEDAVRFLAHLLPNREGVLWAWSCAKSAAPGDASALLRASLAATEKWIAQPNDENRRAAMSAAQEAEVGTPAGAAGLAAFLSGESLAPPGAHPVLPAEHLASKAVAASIMLSAVSSEPEKAPAKYREFLMRGFELAQRTHLWESAALAGTE
jgi:hypothetical protein